MCTNCIVSHYPSCGFRGWGKVCAGCDSGKRPKCSFNVSPKLFQETNGILKQVTSGGFAGKLLYIFSWLG